MKVSIHRLWPVLVLVFAGCGGGGSGSQGSTTDDGYPVVTQRDGFRFPSLADVPVQSATAGQQRGRVLDAGGAPAAAGWRVELVDASNPDVPVVLATGTTVSGGTFELAEPSAAAIPSSRWIRITRPDASQVRAFAAGWTEVTPGTELAVAELSRLDKAGAFAHTLTSSEIDAAQRSGTVWWHGQPERPASAAAQVAMLEQLRVNERWNAMLDNLAAATPLPGAGDVSRFMPQTSASLETTVTRNGAVAAERLFINCTRRNEQPTRDCSILSGQATDQDQQWTSSQDGIRVVPTRPVDVVAQLLSQAGPMPLLEYPHAVGTRVVFDNPRMTLSASGTTYRGSVKVTRRTYPMAPVSALGTSLPAVQVVLDYEAALVVGHDQIELLSRETSWYAPGKGRVRHDKWSIRRGDSTQLSSQVVDSVSDNAVADPVLPRAGRIDLVSTPLRHRDAVPATAQDRIYAVVPEGALLELDGKTLAVLRRLELPASPWRVAASADGSRVYVGLDGASVAEIDTANLAIVRRFAVPTGPQGEIHDRVYGLSVDPFDASRVLVLAGDSSVFGNFGTVFIFRAGVWVPASAPTTYPDHGWAAYWLTSVSWSSVRDEFLGMSGGSPTDLYRFRMGAGTVSVQATAQRPDDGSQEDLGGRIVTPLGSVLDAITFNSTRTLELSGFAVRRCGWLDVGGALCQPIAFGDPELVHLDATSGAFLGAYRPTVTHVASGCDSDDEEINLFESLRRTFGGGRVLVSGRLVDDHRCSLQVWSMHGLTD